jgi:heme/copper-type cytochrome/quinol oxidase subunit 3
MWFIVMQNGHLERQLSRKELQDLRNKRTALALLQLSWIIVFVVLVMAYFQIRSLSATWPPEGVEKPGLALPTIATIILVASSLLVRRASNAMKAGQIETFLAQWRLVIGLGIVFVLVMAYQFLAIPFDAPGQYGAMFRVLIGYHMIHALAIGAFLINTYRSGQAGQYSAANFWTVEAAAALWNFVTVAWILFYLVLYWLS